MDPNVYKRNVKSKGKTGDGAINRFYSPVGGMSSYRDIDYTWSLPAAQEDYSDTTGFTVVNNMTELDIALRGGNYKVYLNNGTYDITAYGYTIPNTADFHFRGQSKAGVIITRSSGTSNTFEWGGTDNGASPINVSAFSEGFTTYTIQCDAETQGYLAGNYIVVLEPTNGNSNKERLIRIASTTPTTMTLDELIPFTVNTSDVLYAVPAEDVSDGTWIFENLTMEADDTNSDDGYFTCSGFENYCINATFSDIVWVQRSTNNVGFIDDNNYPIRASGWTFNRCTFESAESVPLEGATMPTMPNHSVWNYCYYNKIHMRYGDGGQQYNDCYFYYVDIYEDGGLYDNCTFEGTAPGCRYIDGPYRDTKNVVNCRYIDIPRFVTRASEAEGSYTEIRSIAATNGATATVDGMFHLSHYIVFDTNTNQLTEIGAAIDSVQESYCNGVTTFTFVGSTQANRVVWIIANSVI